MAAQGHSELLGIHSNMPGIFRRNIEKAALSGAPAPAGLSADEKVAYERLAFVYAEGDRLRLPEWGCARRPSTGSQIPLSASRGTFSSHDARSLAMRSLGLLMDSPKVLHEMMFWTTSRLPG